MKEKIMIIFKYFPIALLSVAFVSTIFGAERDKRQQGAKLPIAQDWRKQPLTPEIARNLARRKAEIKSSHSKFINISEFDIRHSNKMPESVKQSISGGAYINAANEHGTTFLHLICEAQNMNLAFEFVKYGARLLPNLEGKYPQDFITDLAIDVTNDEVQILRTLLMEEVLKYNSSPFLKSHRNKQKGKRK